MLDHLFLTVIDLDRAIAFHERVLPVRRVTALDGHALEFACKSRQHGS